MAKNVFSVPIFFIVFRETLEASLIIAVLLGLAKQVVYSDPSPSAVVAPTNGSRDSGSKHESDNISPTTDTAPELISDDEALRRTRLLRKIRIQILLGSSLGLFIALAIGAAFIAVWFTKASDLWAKSEELWEGIFQLIASILIFVMGVTMLRMDRAKAKWRIKLQGAFEGQGTGKATTGRWVFFILPFITVLREGMEAVVFVGGVSLGQPATSIPLATIVGLICGLIVGFILYQFASRSALTIFLVVMTNLLLLMGAGLFSRAVGAFEEQKFINLLGADSDDAGGNGPGSYLVQGNVWHLDCCNPSDKVNGQGWSIFNAIFGWSNNGSLGTVLAYVFYWIAVIAALVYMKFSEGRIKLFGLESAAGKRRRIRRSEKSPAEPVPSGSAQGK